MEIFAMYSEVISYSVPIIKNTPDGHFIFFHHVKMFLSARTYFYCYSIDGNQARRYVN